MGESHLEEGGDRRDPSLKSTFMVNFKPIALAQILRKVEHSLSGQSHGNISATISHPSPELRVLADPVMLEEALVHIVRNSVEAMPDGGRLFLHAEVRKREAGSPDSETAGTPDLCAIITLEDTGKGMAQEVKERIFEPRFTTKAGPWRGIGLPIARTIVRLHSGSMEVESVPGQGTRVSVCLPLSTMERSS